jgi:hypothetical protein
MGILDLITTRTIVQDDTRRDVWMNYGQTQSEHSHNDQLNLGVHAYGLDLTPDLATTGASSNDWASGTLSHNTVAVDNTSQQPASQGRLLLFDNSGAAQVMEAESNSAYQLTGTYRRSEVMVKVSESDSYTVDFFRVKGGNDHTYSFHSMAGTDTEEGLDLTQAADTDNQPLFNIRKASAPSSDFSVDYNISGQEATDLHLRFTMLGEYKDVSLADYTLNGADMDYILAHRTGSNLESVFTSVIEPYKGSRYIASIEEAAVTKDGSPVSDMEARAVKVTLVNGRVDYIVSALSNAGTYNIDGKFNFKGIEGVYSEMNGTVVTSYVNDGTVIGDKVYDTGAVTGTVTGFTRELSSQNQLSAALGNAYDARSWLVSTSTLKMMAYRAVYTK